MAEEDDDLGILLAFKAIMFLNGVPSSPQRRDASWSKDGILYARCEYHKNPPQDHCGCGVYATTSRTILRGYIHSHANLICPVLLVAACGDTEVWSSGWRAQAAQAHYIVDYSTDREISGVSRKNQIISVDVAERYFGLPVVGMRKAIELIKVSWKSCGYVREDNRSGIAYPPEDFISDSRLAFSKQY